jgi:hypothetical protein
MIALTGFAGTVQRFMTPLAIGAGLAGGIALGLAFADQAVRAGDHRAAALVAFAAAVLFAQVWLLVLITTVRDLLARAGVPARIVSYGALAYVCHRALHLTADSVGSLSAQTSWSADRLAMGLVVAWMFVTMAVATSRAFKTGSATA